MLEKGNSISGLLAIKGIGAGSRGQAAYQKTYVITNGDGPTLDYLHHPVAYDRKAGLLSKKMGRSDSDSSTSCSIEFGLALDISHYCKDNRSSS